MLVLIALAESYFPTKALFRRMNGAEETTGGLRLLLIDSKVTFPIARWH